MIAVPVLLALSAGCAKATASTDSAAPTLASLPAPAAPPASDTPLARFARFAVTQADAAPGTGRQAALFAPQSIPRTPERLDCRLQPLAVAINLDPGRARFDLANPPAAAPGLADALTAIRAAGLRVFWLSALPVSEADRVYAVLRATGLDLDGTDRILLQRKPGESAHDRLLAAATDWCFVAQAGDRPGDFEPALDYLRDPEGPIARALKALLDDGWFVIPQPIA